MDSSQINKLGMYNAVSAVLGEGDAPIATLPALQAAFTEMRSHLTTIQSHARTQQHGTSGTTVDKGRALTAMADATLSVAASVKGYAHKHKLGKLEARAAIKPSTFQRLRELETVTLAQEVHGAATEVMAHLADYGVTAADLTELQAKIDAALAALSAPRIAVAARTSATHLLLDEFRAIDELLRGQIDGLVAKLKPAHPDYYERYHSARGIVDLASSHESVATPPPPPA